MKPGCFASASVFAHDSEVCRACCEFAECSAESLKTLEQIKGLVNVSDLLKRHEAARKASGKFSAPAPQEQPSVVIAGAAPTRKEAPPQPILPKPPTEPVVRKTRVEKVEFEIAPEDEAIISTLPKKPGEHARILCKRNMFEKIKADLQSSRNALRDSSPVFIAIAIDQLINGGCTRKELAAVYMSKTGMKETAAAPHATQAFQILTAFGVAQEIKDRLVTSPAVAA